MATDIDSALDTVRKTALKRAMESGSWEGIEKAASVIKSMADAEKSATDTRNAHRQLRLQWLSSVATVLVPVISLLALFGTNYFQDQQLRETRQQAAFQQETTRNQNEDTQWRDLLTTLRGSQDAFESDVTAAPRLRSFFASPRYGDQARDISIRLMGRLTTAEGFKDLFAIAFPNVSSDSVVKILNVERSLNATRLNIETECSNLSATYAMPANASFGLCTRAISVNDIIKMIKAPFPERALQLRQALEGVYAEMAFLSQTIAVYLKANYAVGAVGKTDQLDMTSNYFYSADMSNVDFSKAKLRDSTFFEVSLDGADLRPMSFAQTYFLASNWWDARNIDQGWLDHLIEFGNPLYSGATFITPPEPTQAHYNERVAKLCQPPRSVCEARNLPFGRAKTGN